jgi:deoxyribodipyrimidine photo-lyase
MTSPAPAPERAAGRARLAKFVRRAGRDYARERNFDFGPERRDNTSLLSPYLRHRLLLETEVLTATLLSHPLPAAQKFVEELFWRAYFKGWLEQHPSVWRDYNEAVTKLVASLKHDGDLRERYLSATGGNTGIDCFDAWVGELVGTGYLHNHARMWFASIWVFTLQLPWQLGADFFYRHLLDGDPASNTLSWRWVSGLHTRGKTYLARVSNIANFTDKRFNPQGQLASSAPPLTEARVHPTVALPEADVLPAGSRFGLLITEEDGCAESLLGDARPDALLGAIATRRRSPLPVGLAAYAFASGAVADAATRAAGAWAVDGRVAEADDWGDLLVEWAARHGLETIVTAYAPVGPVADLLADARTRLEARGVRLLQLRRAYDDAAWPHATRGYFRLKKQIPAILDQLRIVPAGERHDEAV